MPETAVERERTHRFEMWEAVRGRGGPLDVSPKLVRELGIYGGAQSVWVDKNRTAAITADGSGLTVGLLHTGTSYPDDLDDSGVLYHCPETGRRGKDPAEIAATKAASANQLPVFVIAKPKPRAKTRNVMLGWVEAWRGRRDALVHDGSDAAARLLVLLRLLEGAGLVPPTYRFPSGAVDAR